MKPAAPPFVVDYFIAHSEKPQSYLRAIAIESLADEIPGVINDWHDCPGFSFIRIPNVASINPQVAQTNALGAAR